MPCTPRAAKGRIAVLGCNPDTSISEVSRRSSALQNGEQRLNFCTVTIPAAVENLRVLHLDVRGALLGVTEHSDGLADGVAMPVRRILADAIALDAVALVLSHNHPGGDPQPSRADIAATNHLVRAVAPLGIRVHDHVVTGAGRDFSFRAAGLL